jgi:hypothetical protein
VALAPFKSAPGEWHGEPLEAVSLASATLLCPVTSMVDCQFHGNLRIVVSASWACPSERSFPGT